MERKRLTLNDVLEARNEFFEKAGYTELVIVMNLNTFQEIVCGQGQTITKTQAKQCKTMFGMKIKFNNLLNDGIFYIQCKEDYERSNKLSKFITIDGEEIKCEQ